MKDRYKSNDYVFGLNKHVGAISEFININEDYS